MNADCRIQNAEYIVPTLSVGTPPWTLRVLTSENVLTYRDAKRHWLHSHAERGNDKILNKAAENLKAIV